MFSSITRAATLQTYHSQRIAHGFSQSEYWDIFQSGGTQRYPIFIAWNNSW